MTLRVSRLLGHTPARLDEKGRLIVPAKHRDRYEDGLVLSPAHDEAVTLFPTEEFERTLDELAAAPSSDATARAMLRAFTGNAFETAIDRQGRLAIPAWLRDYAGIDRDVVVVGTGTSLEVWAAEKWAVYNAHAGRLFAHRDSGGGS